MREIRTYGLTRGCWPVRSARRAGVYSTTTPSAATVAFRAPRGVRLVLARHFRQGKSSLRFQACAPIRLELLGLARRRGESCGLVVAPRLHHRSCDLGARRFHRMAPLAERAEAPEHQR